MIADALFGLSSRDLLGVQLLAELRRVSQVTNNTFVSAIFVVPADECLLLTSAVVQAIAPALVIAQQAILAIRRFDAATETVQIANRAAPGLAAATIITNFEGSIYCPPGSSIFGLSVFDAANALNQSVLHFSGLRFPRGNMAS